jgi:hypothetical protein
MNARGWVAGAVLVTALALLAGGASGQEARGGKVYKTPQEVFEAARAAGKKGDWKTVASCLTEKSRDQLAGQAVGLALIFKAFAGFDKTGKAKELVKQVDEVLAKHGLTQEKLDALKGAKPKGAEESAKALQKLLGPVKDRNAFIGDLMGVLNKFGGKKENLFDAELKDVKIDGDNATGTVIGKKAGKEQRETFKFKKVGGSWKMEPPEPPKKGPVKPPPPPPGGVAP